MDDQKYRSVKVKGSTYEAIRGIAYHQRLSMLEVIGRAIKAFWLVEAEKQTQQDGDPTVHAERSDDDNHSNHSTRKGDEQ